MEAGHKGIIANLQRKDVIEVPDDAVTFFDDCASACPEDLSPCCGPGSSVYLFLPISKALTNRTTRNLCGKYR